MGASLYYQKLNTDFYQNSFLTGIRSIQTEKNFIIWENNINLFLKDSSVDKLKVKDIKNSYKIYKSTFKVFLKGFKGNGDFNLIKSHSEKLFKFNNSLLEDLKDQKLINLKNYISDWNKLKPGNKQIRLAYQKIGGELFISSVGEREKFKKIARKLNKVSIGNIIILLLLAFSLYLIFIKKILPPLLGIIKTINEVSEGLIKANAVLYNSSSKMNEQVDNKLAEIEKTTESVFETEKIMGSSQELSQKCQEESQKGKNLIKNVSNVVFNFNENMGEIDKSTKDLKHIIESFKQIEKKSKKINSIVSESRLLSFNAEIEAAHAGVFGKGFSVVAEEMGNLAISSGEISRSISNVVITGSNEADAIIKKSRKSIIIGYDSTNEFSKSFHDLEKLFNEIFNLVGEVQSFSQDQGKGIRMASASIRSIQKSVAHDSEEIKTLHGQTENLDENVKKLNKSFSILKNIIFGDND